MSEKIGSATIEVGVDSAGVESGMNRIDGSIARTGKNLDNLGGRGAENLGKIGSGADTAAARVDSATRNIAGAVERANAALIAGKKSGSEYFEELARSRGADLMKLAPLIAQLRETEAAQARAKAALDATAASQVAAAEAARTQASALREVAQAQGVRDNFLGNLREQIQLFGKSADEMLRYRAAQAGAAESAAPLILQLQNMRAAQDAVAESARQESQAQRLAAQAQASRDGFLANLREQIALQGKSAEEVLRYRAALAGAGADAEPLIQQLQRIKAGQDLVTEAARATAAAQQQAAQKQANGEAFIASLREQALLFGKSAEEAMRYRAAQAGVAGAAEPIIRELRQLTDAQDAATEAARRASAAQQQAAQRQAAGDNMLVSLREQVALYGKSAEEALRYRAAQAGIAGAAEPIIQELQRLRVAQDAVTEAARLATAAQQQAATVRAGQDAFMAGLREQIALYGKSAEEVLRYRAVQLGLAGAADPLLAQLQSVKTAQDAVAAAARTAAEAQRQVVQAQAGKDNFVASLQQQAAAIGKTRTELLELQAAQMGVSNQAAPFIQKLREAEQGLNNAGMSARATAAAIRGVPAQFTDIIVSLQGGQAPLTVLLQQGGQLKDMFGGAGNAAKALGGYVLGLINPYTVAAAAAAALAVAYYQGQAEAKAFALSIAMTGNVAGVTAGQLGDMAKAASEAAGTQGKNAEVLAQLVGTGKVGADQLVAASVAAVRSQKFLGIEVENTVKAYADLGADPLKATLKLSEQYGYLTLSTYQQIKALENQGRTLEAAKVAQAAYGDAMLKKSKDVEASLGTLSRTWNSVASGAKSAWDAMLDVGRQDSLDDKLKKAEDRVKKARLAFFSFAGSDAQKQAELDAAERDRDSLLNQRKVASLKAEQEGADQRRNKAAVEFSEQAEKYLTRREKMLLEIDKITALANKGRPIAGYDEESIKAAQDYEKKFQASIAGIRGQYADVNNAGIASQIGAVQRLGEVQEEVAKRARINLDMQQQSGGMQALDKRIAYAEAVAKMDEQAIQREKARAQQRLSITAAETVSADQQGAQQEKLAALRGQIAKADQEILTRRVELTKEVFDLDISSSRAAFDSLDKLLAAREGEATAIEDQVRAQRDANAVIGMSSEQAAAYNRNLVEETAARKELDAAVLETIAGREGEAAALRRSATAMRDLFDAQQAGAMKKELADFLDPNKAKDFGDALRDAFGGAGSALVKLSTTFQSFAKGQKDFSKQRANAAELYLNGQKDEAEYTRDITQLNKMQAHEQLKGYGDMAGAAAGFFGEQSKGYKALTTMSQVFHAAELAMTLAELVPKGISAVLSQGQGDPYSAFARMAAMAAIVAGLGVAISGGGGGGVDVAKQRQEVQGTGTVFGDSTAKSDSIKRSLELVSSNSSIELSYTQGMLAALRNIETSLSGLGNVLVRNSGLTSSTVAATGSSAQEAFMFMQPFWSIGAKSVGNLVGKIFGGKTTVEDTGFKIDPTTLGAGMAGNLNSFQYTDIKKSGGWFSSDDWDTKWNALGGAADAQFAAVLKGLGGSVAEAAKLLGLGGDAFTQRLNGFVIDIGKISLKDMSSEEIQKTLESVFSKLGDDLASYAVAGLDVFAQIGEGPLETLTRIAANYANLDSILASSGTSFGQVGMSSIAARERLIALAGGIDELASAQASFNDSFLTEAERLAPVQKYVTDQLAAMGLQSLDTRDKFKDYVLGLANGGKLATESGAAQYTALLALADAFAKTHAATVDLSKSEQEIADQRTDLQNQLAELTMTQAQLASKARKEIAAGNLPLYDELTARQALAAAYETESTAIASTIDKLKTFASAIKSFRDGLVLGNLSTLTLAEKAAAARDQYSTTLGAARGGDATAQSGLSAAATAFLTASQAGAASRLDYARDYARVQADMAILAASVGSQLTDAEKQQVALDKQVKGLITINDSVNAGAATVAQAIASLGVLGVKQIDGSHAGGLSRVPFDGYTAELHAGERVLTAFEAREYSARSSVDSTGDIAAAIDRLTEENRALRAELTEFKSQAQAADVSMAQSLGKVARLAQRWDENGLLVRADEPIPTKETVTS